LNQLRRKATRLTDLWLLLSAPDAHKGDVPQASFGNTISELAMHDAGSWQTSHLHLRRHRRCRCLL
jgi:hypothetical protein